MLPVVEEHQHRGAGERDGRRLEVQRTGEHEQQDHGGQHHERLLEQGPIPDRLARVHRHHPGAALRRRSQVLAPEQMNHQRLHRHHHDDHRGEVDDEGVEVQADLRADQDVRRVADQGGGAADIGGEDLGEQNG